MMFFAPGALADLERILDFYQSTDPAVGLEHLARIQTAVTLLEQHPHLGRRVQPRSSLRELIISHGKTGFVALYEYSQLEELIRVVAVRHQREAGYRAP